MRKLVWTILPALLLPLAACGSDSSTEQPADELTPSSDDYVKSDDGKEDSSLLATILDFEFDGEMVTDYAWDANAAVQNQLLFTIGQLNGNTSVGRLDRVALSNVVKSTTPDGKTLIKYHAKMPVAWGSKTNLPTKYTFILPRDVSSAANEAFTTKYKTACTEIGAHDVDAGSVWYYYRPNRSGCTFTDTDVVKLPATVTVSAVNTTGKYPEFHKVWEDKALKIVAVFGKYEDGAKTAADAGVAAYNEFVAASRKALTAYSPVSTPATVPAAPGVESPDVQFDAKLPDGRTVQINALLVDNISQATPAFYARYEGLSTRADLIQYNGHAGLGQNVRALAKKGKWVADQYLILFMNGCDTYAYVDGSLAQTRAAVNPSDPTGTKFMEIVTNAMPAYFASDSEATMAMINGLMAYKAPTTYEQMFKNVDAHQIVLVTGENDNVYYPGYGETPVQPDAGTTPATWSGIDESFTIAKAEDKRWATETVPAGKYRFALTGTGDADLYVRVGTAPDSKLYDCRPYKSGSKETCDITLNSDAPIHALVRGYKATSAVRLVAKKL